MSYSTMLGVPSSGPLEEIEEYSNGWGTAPIIWDGLFKKYLKSGSPKYASWMTESGKLWKLPDRKDLPEFEKNMLLLTCDRMILKKEYFPRIIECIEKWSKENPPKEGTVYHWVQIAKDLKELDLNKYIGVCFIWTSVADYVWDSGTRDEEDERCYWDISKDKGHWFLLEDE